MSDLEGFRNLLSDKLYEKLGHEPRPMAERLTAFFSEDLVVLADEGEPLPGRIVETGPRNRMRRDEITGEPLPPAGEAETVIFVRLLYPVEGQPRSARLRCSGRASGGAQSRLVLPVRNSRNVRPMPT